MNMSKLLNTINLKLSRLTRAFRVSALLMAGLGCLCLNCPKIRAQQMTISGTTKKTQFLQTDDNDEKLNKNQKRVIIAGDSAGKFRTNTQEVYEFTVNNSGVAYRVISKLKSTDGKSGIHQLSAIEIVPGMHRQQLPQNIIDANGIQWSVRKNQDHYWIGVRCEPLTDTTKTQLKIDHGLAVHEVVPQSPAQKAGIKVHDILLQVGQRRFETTNHLVETIDLHKSRDVEFDVIRTGSVIKVSVKPELRPQPQTEQIVLGVFEKAGDSKGIHTQLEKINRWVEHRADSTGQNLEVFLVRPGIAFDQSKFRNYSFHFDPGTHKKIEIKDIGSSIQSDTVEVHTQADMDAVAHFKFMPGVESKGNAFINAQAEVLFLHRTPQDIPHLVLKPGETGNWVAAAQAGDQGRFHMVLADTLDHKADSIMEHIVKLEGVQQAIDGYMTSGKQYKVKGVQLKELEKQQDAIKVSIEKLRKRHSTLKQRIRQFNVTVDVEGLNKDILQKLQGKLKTIPSLDPPPIKILDPDTPPRIGNEKQEK